MFAKVWLAGLMVLLMAGLALAITIDGVNDFPPSSLIDADGGDTEFAPLDLGDIYVTYDNTNLYIGYAHDHDGWGTVQVGMAFVTDHSGGSTDPWGRMISFGGMCLPHYVAYINLDSGWNEWCAWNDGGWWDRTANVLSWSYSTGFDEIAIPFAMLGIDCRIFSNMGFEMWVTQDSPTKGPLDLSINDGLQLSKPSGTTWDITTPVLIACYHCIILDAPSATDITTWGNIKALYR
jgi:hypothetical protein